MINAPLMHLHHRLVLLLILHTYYDQGNPYLRNNHLTGIPPWNLMPLNKLIPHLISPLDHFCFSLITQALIQTCVQNTCIPFACVQTHFTLFFYYREL